MIKIEIKRAKTMVKTAKHDDHNGGEGIRGRSRLEILTNMTQSSSSTA